MSAPFLRIRSFVNSLTQRFTSFTPTYFGLLHYNYKVLTSARLTEQIPNSQSLRNRIRDMGYLGQATLTQSALTSAKALFDSGARNDPDVQKVLILFTDGRTYGGKQTLREPLKKLREVSVCLLLYKLVPKGENLYTWHNTDAHVVEMSCETSWWEHSYFSTISNKWMIFGEKIELKVYVNHDFVSDILTPSRSWTHDFFTNY